MRIDYLGLLMLLGVACAHGSMHKNGSACRHHWMHHKLNEANCPCKSSQHAMVENSNASMGEVTLVALNASGITGRVVVTSLGKNGVRLDGILHGMVPGSVHGFHVHEKGDCSAADGSSAGDHFNPTMVGHGAPGSMEAHAGDLGNITADANGTAMFSLMKPNLNLNGSKDAILGHSLVLHANADDLKSQPAGNSGERLACGVIVSKQ